jgi:outer membrane protein assembly factor BamB
MTQFLPARLLLCAFAVCVGNLLSANSVSAQEWTRFRGPNGTGLSDTPKIPTTWTEKDYNWQTELPGYGHSSPVLWGETIFLTSASEDGSQRIALGINAITGKILWERRYNSTTHKKHLKNSYASSTPAVDEKHVYVCWSAPKEFDLIALDHYGNEVWKTDLGPFVSQHSCGTSPIVYEDMVILCNEQDGVMKDNDGAGKSSIMALDRMTGKIRWQVERVSAVVTYSTPYVYQPAGQPDELIFNSQGQGMTAVDPKTGKTNWEISILDKRSVSSPILAGGLLFASCGSGGGGNYVVAVKPGSATTGKQAEIAYKVDKSAPYVPTPIAKGNLVFLWGDGGVVACVKADSGDLLWRNRVEGGGNFSGSPVCVEDKLYCIAENGDVVVLAAADQFKQLGRVSLGEQSHSTPSIAGGCMYLRTVSHLYSLGGKKRKG